GARQARRPRARRADRTGRADRASTRESERVRGRGGGQLRAGARGGRSPCISREVDAMKVSLLRILNITKVGLMAIARNKLRSALTMLGIIIGVCCVITI